MKKIFTLISFCVANLIAIGQVSFDNSHNDTAQGSMSAFDLAAHSLLQVTDSGTYRWVRTSVTLDGKIETAICDNENCYPVDTDSANFKMKANSTFNMTCYFYPNGDCGYGKVVMKVYKVDDPSQSASAEFDGYAWCNTGTLAVKQIEDVELRIGPNPATSTLNIQVNSSSVGEVAILDILGNQVMQLPFNGRSERINVSTLSQGIYFVSLKIENRVINKSFVKK